MRLKTAPFFPFASGRIALIALSTGPVAEGLGGSRDDVWAWWVETSGVHHLSNLSSSLPPESFPPPSYTVDLDASALQKVGLEFDQNNRRVLAWQGAGSPSDGASPYTQSGATVILSYIETGVPEVERRVSWDGLEPVLFWDGQLLEDSTLTDIVCYYLSADRLRLCYRLQSDLYAVEYTWLTLPRAMAIADWKTVSRRFGLELADAEGNLYDVLSEPYPTYVRDAGQSIGRLSRGVYWETIVVRDPYAEASLSAGRLAGGEHRLTILTTEGFSEAASSEGRLSRGSYRLQGQLFDPGRDAGNLSGRLEGGEYRLVFVSSGDEVTEFARGSGRLSRGSYRVVGALSDPASDAGNASGRLVSGAYTFRSVSAGDALAESASSSSRLARGSYRSVSQLFDEVADAGIWGPGRLRGGSLVQRIAAPVGADADAGRVAGRMARGTLSETNRIQRFLEAALQAGRLARGNLEFNPFVSPEPLVETVALAGRLRGGAYALAPNLHPYYDLFMLVDGGEGPDGEALEYLHGQLGGY